MAAYYNENDPVIASWLKELITAGLIAHGEVDTRSIAAVSAADLDGYEQCHFFAGIGGWSAALRLADWPDDRAVWTGSCPCQPFSSAGQKDGADDPRDLWPTWFGLIRQRKPAIVFGEQVASAYGLGWLDRVASNLEAEDYAVGALDLGAAYVGAPHRRQRVWWVGVAAGGRREWLGPAATHGESLSASADAGTVANADPHRQRTRSAARLHVGDSAHGHDAARRCALDRDPWSNAEWIECRDGTARPIEPGTLPLAHGIPARVGRLRGYGNAIVPQVAAAFIRASVDALEAIQMQHRTRVEATEITILEDGEQRQAIAYRAHCHCGYVSPVPLLTQSEAFAEARDHRETYADVGAQADV